MPVTQTAAIERRDETHEDAATRRNHYSDRIRWFITTGFPRSGNTWFETMLSEIDGVGGFSPSADRGLPITFSILRISGLARLVNKRQASWASVLRRLLDPGGSDAAPFDPTDRTALRRIMINEIAPHVRRIRNNFYEAGQSQSMSIDFERLIDALVLSSEDPTVRSTPAAFGCPSKHLPPAEIAEQLGGFTIIRVTRDPRDSIISKLYHDLGKLGRGELETLARQAQDGRWITRIDWKQRYFTSIGRRLNEFFNGDLPRDHSMIEIRYEALLSDTVAELGRVARALGLNPSQESLSAVVERYRFDRVTGGTAERRNSFIRKGQSGDWKNYFDRELVEILGPEFIDLVQSLGYERDGLWVDSLPERAPHQFDFSRFRIRRSATAAFIGKWLVSPELQSRFPQPMETRGESNTFYHWLRECAVHDDDDVRRWFEAADSLVREWRVNIVEDAFH